MFLGSGGGRTFAAILLTLVTASATWAGEGFLHSIAIDTARNNCWPDAFVPTDRTSVRLPFMVMVTNGWMRQNLIGDYLFDESGQALTEAGRRRVEWIVTQAPIQHRTIYVKRSRSAQITDARVQAVIAAAKEVLPPDQKVEVRVTDLEAPGWPAEYVDYVERSYYKTIPQPRLPPRGSSGADSGASGAN